MEKQRFDCLGETIVIPIPKSYVDCVTLIKSDYYRIAGTKPNLLRLFLATIRMQGFQYLFWMRMCSYHGLAFHLCKLMYRHYSKLYGVSIPYNAKIGYGLYVVTCNDGKKDNGLIVNTVSQVTDSPNRVSVCINKQNYSHHVIKQTGILNVNCLSVDAPFSIFQRFGFQSGRTADKFENFKPLYSDNGLPFLPKYINAFMSLKVEQYIDLDTHGMFICTVTEARVVSDRETMTYNYYQSNVKPKPNTEGKKGWVCKVCGYIYEEDELPEDIVCPLCKHGASDFERIQ